MPMRLNFLSGIGMAVALANLAAVLFLLTGKRWIGFIIAAIFALHSHCLVAGNHC